MKYLKLKFLLMFFALAMAIPPTWAETVTDVIDRSVTLDYLGTTNNSNWATDFSVTGASGAEYKIHSMGLNGLKNPALNWNANGYLCATKSGGRVKSITVAGDGSTNKSVDIYASNVAYSSTPTGTVVATIKLSDSGTTYNFTEDQNFTYVAVKGKASSTRPYSVTIVWEKTEGPTIAVPTFSYNNEAVTGSVQVNQNDVINITSAEGTVISYTTDGSDPGESNTAVMTDGNSAAVTITQDCTIKAIALDDDLNQSFEATLNVIVPMPSGIIYKKVNSSNLKDGGTYVIIYEGDPAAAMGEIVNKKGSSITGIILDKTKNEVDLASKNALLLTARAVGNDGKYAFEIEEDSYLNINDANFNTSTTSSANTAQWIVMGDGRVYNVSATSRYIIYRAGTSNVFGPYASTNVNNTEYFYAYLYEKVESTPEPVDPELAFAEGTPTTVYVGDEVTLAVNNVPEGATLSFTCDPEGAVTFENGKATFKTAGEVTITANTTATDEYTAGTATCTIMVEAKPFLLADEAVELETTVGTPVSETFDVSGENLKGDITLTLNDTKGVFTIDPTSIAKADAEGTITVTYTPKDEAVDEATITIESKDAEKLTVSLTGMATLPDPVLAVSTDELEMGTNPTGKFTVTGQNLTENVTLTVTEGTAANFEITPATITPDEDGKVNQEITVTYKGTSTTDEDAIITVKSGKAEQLVMVTAKAETYVDLAKPTFSPAAGTYTEPKQVAIACATPGVTIEYTIDGVTKTYEGPFTVDHTCTVTATAKMGNRTVYTPATNSATYTINAAPAAGIEDGYYSLQNNAEEVAGKYANVAGRRTLNFVADPDDKAGTIFRIQTDPDTLGQIETLRSQGVDLQGYANRAMAYVPKAIELVLSKLANSSLGDPETPGDGILGENGLDLILEKFYKNFDYHLYIEQAEGGYRIYGKTPSMQHVVDFYHENTAQVEAKLPKLEGYINQVLDKIRNRIPAPYNANVVLPFSLKAVRDSIAKKNGITLIDPTEDEMGFYRQVLNNKEYVWDFAYQTAMMYVDAIKATQTYAQLPAEYKLYVEKMEKVRPDTKYYIIERGNELDYISENNVEIINNDPRTLWTITERETFKLSSAGELFGCPLATTGVGGYFTTNYTDFAYTLPEGVTAYKVTGVNEDGEAQLEALEGTIPAQTPVLLVAKEDGAYEVTLTTDAGTAVGTNELKGPDYLITEYQIQTPIVVQLFSFAQGILGDNLYNTYVAPYEYLQLRYSGTVNNKYFWNVNSDLDELNGDCVVRSLATDENGKLAFSDHWTTENNKAFMVSEDYNAITLPGSLRGDVNHDGIVHISDVPALIDRLLEADFRACPYCSDVNEDNVVNIRDVPALIDILLGVDGSTTGTEEGGGE